MTEAQVVEIIEKVSRSLAPIYRFGYHSIEDMQQQAKIIAIQGIEDSYDESRPLENFLWTHVHNRLYNYKRDNFERPDKPCFKCPLNAYDPNLLKSDSKCTLHTNLINCEWYAKWHNRNAPKRNLMSTTDIDNINDEKENNMKRFDESLETIDSRQIFDIIDQHLPIPMREDYLKMKHGVRIPKKRTLEIINFIKGILIDNGIDPDQEAW